MWLQNCPSEPLDPILVHYFYFFFTANLIFTKLLSFIFYTIRRGWLWQLIRSSCSYPPFYNIYFHHTIYTLHSFYSTFLVVFLWSSTLFVSYHFHFSPFSYSSAFSPFACQLSLSHSLCSVLIHFTDSFHRCSSSDNVSLNPVSMLSSQSYMSIPCFSHSPTTIHFLCCMPSLIHTGSSIYVKRPDFFKWMPSYF